MENINEKLFDFIHKSPCAVFAVDTVKDILQQHGFREFKETEYWELTAGTKGYVVRNESSLIAFSIPQSKMSEGFHMVCAHTDSPSFKIKEMPVTQTEEYAKLNVEKYGSMIMESWLDRPLSLAGRVVADTENGLESRHILLENAFIIPRLAIHMTKGAQQELNPQTDMQPLAGEFASNEGYFEKLGELSGFPKEKLLGADLFLVNNQRGSSIGFNREYISAPRLDDLQCVFAGVNALVNAEKGSKIALLGLFDNEEVGSLTRQGADSDFLSCTLHNIAEGLGKNSSDLRRSLQKSFMVSADNAHAVHPNHQEKADVTNRPHLNKGIVIKYHGNQKYTTDAFTGAYVKKLCIENDIPFQTYHNRSDIAGGSTLGNIALGKVSVPAADIGAPQLAMHSAFETAGAYDTEAMVRFMKCYFER
jgi:aspartyl aminopeptidase